MYYLIKTRFDKVIVVKKTSSWQTAYDWCTQTPNGYEYEVWDHKGRLPGTLKTPAQILDYLRRSAKKM